MTKTLTLIGVAAFAGCSGDIPSTPDHHIDAPTQQTDASTTGGDASTFGAAGWNVTPTTAGLAGIGKTCAGLPLYTGTLTPTAATTIADVRVQGPLRPQTTATITIQRSCIIGGIQMGNVVITDSDIVGATTADRAFDGTTITLQRSNIDNVSVGVWFRGFGTTNTVLIEDSYIRANIAIETQSFNGTSPSAIIHRNHLVGTSASNVEPTVYLGTNAGANIQNVTFERNLIENPNHLIELQQTGSLQITGAVATDNRFSTGTNVVTGATWATWTENYRYDSSGVDGKGATVPAP